MLGPVKSGSNARALIVNTAKINESITTDGRDRGGRLAGKLTVK